MILVKKGGVSIVDNQKFAKEFNETFSAPFLPDGFATAKVNDEGDLIITIGNRDLQLDKDGGFIGAGTQLVGGWHIVPSTQLTQKFDRYKCISPKHSRCPVNAEGVIEEMGKKGEV
jgi:hypothetical protein